MPFRYLRYGDSNKLINQHMGIPLNSELFSIDGNYYQIQDWSVEVAHDEGAVKVHCTLYPLVEETPEGDPPHPFPGDRS